MIDAILRDQLVSVIISGNQENFPVRFGEFADKVTSVCSAPEDWTVNSAELIKLKSTLELYKMTYTGVSDAVIHIIGVTVTFIHEIRDYFSNLHSPFTSDYGIMRHKADTDQGCFPKAHRQNVQKSNSSNPLNLFMVVLSNYSPDSASPVFVKRSMISLAQTSQTGRCTIISPT